jgi:hypothetical protein
MGACGQDTFEAEKRRIDYEIDHANMIKAAREAAKRRWEIRLAIIRARNERRKRRREARRQERRNQRKLIIYQRISKNLFKKCIIYLVQKNPIPDLYIRKAADIRRKMADIVGLHLANRNDDRRMGLEDLEGTSIIYYHEIAQKMPRASIINHAARKTWWMAEKEKVKEGFKNEYYCLNNNIPNKHRYN